MLTANAFGVAPFELDLASELNYGTWKITAESGSASGCLDVRVEKYVLPRFSVECVTDRDYFLVDEEVAGTIKANYFFGAPVTKAKVKYKVMRSDYSASWYPVAPWDWRRQKRKTRK